MITNIEEYFQQFLKLYKGHTLYIPATKGEYDPIKKKVKYNYNKKRIPLDIEAVIKHINFGTPHIVVNPINEITGLCKFGALDIDDYNPDHLEKIKKKIYEKKLPLHIIISASGGLHLYFYSDVPIEPKLMKAILKYYGNILELPDNTEIFPKQDDLKNSPFGNNIKLPCAGVREKGLKEHLRICEKLIQTKEMIEKLPLDLDKVIPEKTVTKFSAKQIIKNIKEGKTHHRGGTYDNWITDLIAKYVYVGTTNKQILDQLNHLKKYSNYFLSSF